MSGEFLFDGVCIKVRFLPGCTQAEKEWRDEVDASKLIHSLAAADSEVTGPARRIRKDRAEQVLKVNGGAIWELKGPPRGKIINRALLFVPRGYEMYVVFASMKKQQELPQHWIDTAKARILKAQREGAI